jgi:hypothetical protein
MFFQRFSWNPNDTFTGGPLNFLLRITHVPLLWINHPGMIAITAIGSPSRPGPRQRLLLAGVGRRAGPGACVWPTFVIWRWSSARSTSSDPHGIAARQLPPALDAADGDGVWRPGCCVEEWRKAGGRWRMGGTRHGGAELPVWVGSALPRHLWRRHRSGDDSARHELGERVSRGRGWAGLGHGLKAFSARLGQVVALHAQEEAAALARGHARPAGRPPQLG